MKPVNIICILFFGLVLVACGGSGAETETNPGVADLSAEEQVELVAAAISNDEGGIGGDIAIVSQAAEGPTQQGLSAPQASYGYSVTINVDYYDVNDELQDGYDALTTDRIDYDSQILGEITDGDGYFDELSIDNRSDFTMDEILSRVVWINGIHTNQSSYTRTNPITTASIAFELDCALTVTDVTVDLDAADDFPESGTIEGRLSGAYERTGPFGNYSRSVSFHFIATYIGDNTAEIELDDGTVYIVRLDDGSIEPVE